MLAKIPELSKLRKHAGSVESELITQSPPDLILFNGEVFTSNSSRPYVEAPAIRGERIVAVGASKETVALSGKETKRIDLGGRTVIPGINDAHYHLGVGPKSYDLPIKSDDPKWQEIVDALSSAVANCANVAIPACH